MELYEAIYEANENKMIKNEEECEKAVLIGIDDGNKYFEASFDELYSLSETAGIDPSCELIQNREKPDNRTFLGKGKLEELKLICHNRDIKIAIFNNELSPVQKRNLEDELNIEIIDRTMLILEIFAMRAKSSEGKIQVELARLKYMLPRLTGKGIEMSRIGGGGGGTAGARRGSGETKLETDRRHIRSRIDSLKRQLTESEKHRQTLKKARIKSGIKTVAIVGYTNAGKSTLMNLLTDAGVLAEDKLFATLDPTSRALKLPDGRTVILIDTVGLIRDLPYHLIEAFKSTLEEAATADVILNICDISSEQAANHLEVTKDLLMDLGLKDTPVINVMNKCDLINSEDISVIGAVVKISAKNAVGVDKLLEEIIKALPATQKNVELLIPFSKANYAALIRKEGIVESEEYIEEGLKIKAVVDIKILKEIAEYII